MRGAQQLWSKRYLAREVSELVCHAISSVLLPDEYFQGIRVVLQTQVWKSCQWIYKKYLLQAHCEISRHATKIIWQSVSFQVEYILRQKKNLSAYLRPCKILQLGPDFFIPHDADDDTTHSTLVDVDEPMGSSDSENLSAACTNFVRKKRSGPYICARSANRVSDEDMAANMSRRKGVPHRSPLC